MKCFTEAELAKIEANAAQGQIAQRRLDWLLAHLWSVNIYPQRESLQLTLRSTAQSGQPMRDELLAAIDKGLAK